MKKWSPYSSKRCKHTGIPVPTSEIIRNAFAVQTVQTTWCQKVGLRERPLMISTWTTRASLTRRTDSEGGVRMWWTIGFETVSDSLSFTGRFRGKCTVAKSPIFRALRMILWQTIFCKRQKISGEALFHQWAKSIQNENPRQWGELSWSRQFLTVAV